MTPQPLNRPCGVDVLSVIKESARLLYLDVADEGAACDRLLEAKAKVAELIEALSECVVDMQTTEDYYGNHPRAQEVIARAKAALAALEGQP